jgi:hypothetical protein
MYFAVSGHKSETFKIHLAPFSLASTQPATAKKSGGLSVRITSGLEVRVKPTQSELKLKER